MMDMSQTVPFVITLDDLRSLNEIFADNEEAIARAVRRVVEQGDEVCRFNSFAQ